MYDTSQQPQEMRDRYKLLPQEITDLFDYDTVKTVLDETAAEFGLNAERSLLLQMEVELVLYLLLPRSGFAERIQDSMGIDASRARGIADKINNDLFIIIEDILEFAERQFSAESAEAADTLIVTPPIIKEQSDTSTVESQPTDNANTQVKPLRTFAMDVDVSRAHGYGAFHSGEDENKDDEPIHRSSQDDIIKK